LLLIATVVGASLVLYSLLFQTMPLTSEFRDAEYQRCRELADPLQSGVQPTDRLQLQLESSQCTRRADGVEAATMLGGVALVLLIATGLYWTAPRRKIRREHLRPLSGKDAPPELVTELAELCREAELEAAPSFLWDPLDRGSNASAFGRVGQYFVALQGGLVMRCFTDRPLFRAIVRHELAHVRNGDLERTYVAIATWQSFLLVAVLPFVLSLFAPGRSAGDLAVLIGRVLLLAALVYLMRNAVLRARELYADVRASVWDGPDGALGRAIEASQPVEQTRWWRRAVAVHPEAGTREAVLEDPSSLFQAGYLNALAAGVAGGVAFPSLEALFELLIPFPWSLLRPLVAAVAIAPLLVGVVGLDLWRAAFAAMARSTGVRNAGRIGLVVGVGFAIGQTLSLAEAFFPLLSDQQLEATGIVLIVLTVLWAAVLCGVLAIFFRWIAIAASTWLEIATSERSPRRACAINLVVASGLLAVWLSVLFMVYVVVRWTGALLLSPELWFGGGTQTGSAPVSTDIGGLTPLGTGGVILLLLVSLVPTATLLVVWGLPLAPGFGRAHVGAVAAAPCFYLEPTSAADAWRPRLGRPLQVRRAASYGALSGLVFCLLSLVAYALLRGEWAIWILSVQPLLAAILLVVLQVAVMLEVTRLRALHALLAATLGVSIMLCGAFLLLALFNYLPSFSLLESIAFLAITSSMASLLVVATCVLAAGGASLVRLLRARIEIRALTASTSSRV
jgi:hypothetical protein